MTNESQAFRNFDPDEAFFVIDSYNLSKVKSELYGYCIVNNKIIDSVESLSGFEPTGEGAYIYIKRDGGKITIKQDFVGCFGIYIYRDGDYFALSNSFIYLVDYIKTRFRITFNKLYADYFLAADLCSVSYSETIINEISLMDRSAVIELNILDKSISWDYIDYKENTIELDSEEGIGILDNWYHKWTSIIKNLYDNNEDIVVDLSGGFDSRVSFLLVLKSGIDLNKIQVKSNNDSLYTHSEDFEIASQIADHFGFTLNNDVLSHEVDHYSVEDIFNISWYTKALFHKQMYYKNVRIRKPRFLIPGAGGELIRNHSGQFEGEEKYIEKVVNRSRKYWSASSYSQNAVSQILSKSYGQIREKISKYGDRIISSDILTKTAIYRDTINRSHFGKAVVENYYGNILNLPPFFDSDLNKIKATINGDIHEGLLYAVVFDRYCRELLDFKFEGNRSFEESILNKAEEINKKFPYYASTADSDKPMQIINHTGREMHNIKKVQPEEISQITKKAFQSGEIRNTFIQHYNEKVYNCIADDSEKRKYHPLQDVYVVLGMCKILDDISINEAALSSTTADFIIGKADKKEPEPLPLQNKLISPYIATARIDIKNTGSDGNNVTITEISDKNAKIQAPAWFLKNGSGHIVMSNEGSISITVRCVKSGKLDIALRDMDIRNENGERVPIWIDYQKFIINDEIVFENTRSICHDQPFKIARDVSDGEVVTICAEWTPHETRNIFNHPKIPIKKVTSLPPHSNTKKSDISQYQIVAEVVIPRREHTEWLNFWFDNSNTIRNDRILLIGDSISRDYRGSLAALTGRPIDFFATSSYFTDDLFWKQLDFFFSIKEYRQSKAQIQIGIHGVNGFKGIKSSNSLREWEIYYEKLVEQVMEIIPDLTIALTTPITQTDNLSVLDDYMNGEIIKRNEIAAKIAEKYKLNINDLYTLMLGETHTDRAHFSKAGSEKLARKVAEALDLI